MSDKPHIVNNSGKEEWYTPLEYLEAARIVLGEINFDPASSHVANELVDAHRYCTIEENGLIQRWYDKFWLNPPYSRGKIDEFVSKIGYEIQRGNVTTGIVLTNNATDTKWWHQLADMSCSICFVKGRIRYLDENLQPANAPLQGQTFFLIDTNYDILTRALFAREFGKFGKVTETLVHGTENTKTTEDTQAQNIFCR